MASSSTLLGYKSTPLPLENMDSQSFTVRTLQPLFLLLSYLENGFMSLPGSAVILRYIRESHRDDPGRTILEILLALFALWTLVQSRRRAGRESKGFVKLTEQEIDELVDEWHPEPLVAPLSAVALSEFSKTPIIIGPAGPRPRVTNSVIDPTLSLTPANPIIDPTILSNVKSKEVINLASFQFTSLSSVSGASTGNSPRSSPKHVKDAPLPGTETAITTLRKYGLGSCGPPGFYGTLDVHLELEQTIAQFLGTESAIIYSQSFSTASSVIPSFAKRGDIIVADRGINFVIQKGLQLSRSTLRWYDHNDLKGSLVSVLEGLQKETRRKREKNEQRRRFIVTEGLFADSGTLTDLPVLLSIAKKYKYRVILDESLSIGTLGRTGRGLTELYNVRATEVDMIIGSMALTMGSTGGFCAGSHVVCEHQRINSTALVFSAALPALLATASTEAIHSFVNHPEMFTRLQENVKAIRGVFAGVDGLEIIGDLISPIVHLAIKSSKYAGSNGLLTPDLSLSSLSSLASSNKKTQPNNPSQIIARDAPAYDIPAEEKILQEIVDEALINGVLITRAKRLWGEDEKLPLGQEWHPIRPSIRIAVSSALTKKECEKAAGVVKAAWTKVLGRKR